MLPYFQQPAWHLGPVTIHAFGVAVAAAIWTGLTFAERRLAGSGLDALTGRQLGAWMLAGGIVGAHLYSVLLYFPDQLRADPWLFLRVWEDISSLGGMLGGAAGALLYFALARRELDRRTQLRYLDAVAFVFPFGLAIGRIGCALAHDHPGVVTKFPLAISLQSASAQEYVRGIYDTAGLSLPALGPGMGFHDLGLYECLFLALVVIPAFRRWDRVPRAPGFYLIAFAVLYFPVRFALDLLRVSDARYLRLTPAQWAAAAILSAVPLAALGHRRIRFIVSGAVILATAWACWGGPV